MLNLTTSSKIYVYTSVTDMRKGVHGLSGIVRSEFAADPTDGSLFVFVNRRRDRLKILYFDGGGFWLYYRLLEAGTFEELKNPSKSIYLTIDATELSMLLSGVSLVASSRRRKRFSKKQTEQAA
jgi:transposase